MVRRRTRTIKVKDDSHLEEIKTFLQNHRESLQEALDICDRETIDDIFFLNEMLNSTDKMIKSISD